MALPSTILRRLDYESGSESRRFIKSQRVPEILIRMPGTLTLPLKELSSNLVARDAPVGRCAKGVDVFAA
jgi:hypothetical protein